MGRDPVLDAPGLQDRGGGSCRDVHSVRAAQHAAETQMAPGPVAVIPFLGTAIEMVANPTKYWDDQVSASTQAIVYPGFISRKLTSFLR